MLGPFVEQLPHVVVQRGEDLAGDLGPVVGGPPTDDRGECPQHRGPVAPAQGAHLGAQPYPDTPHGFLAGFDQRQLTVVAADVEPEKVTPLVDVDDAGLVLVEDQAPGLQPLRQPLLDLFRLLATVAEGQKIVGIADQRGQSYAVSARPALRLRYLTPAACSIPCKTMFSSTGLMTPPCGAPCSVGANRPSSTTPACNHRRIIPRPGNDPRGPGRSRDRCGRTPLADQRRE